MRDWLCSSGSLWFTHWLLITSHLCDFDWLLVSPHHNTEETMTLFYQLRARPVKTSELWSGSWEFCLFTEPDHLAQWWDADRSALHSHFCQMCAHMVPLCSVLTINCIARAAIAPKSHVYPMTVANASKHTLTWNRTCSYKAKNQLKNKLELR